MKTIRWQAIVVELLIVASSLFVMGGSRPVAGQSRVSIAQARARIKRHIAHIEEQKKYMTDTYYYAGAVKTLEASFREHGVTTSMRYADSWGTMGIGLTWSQSARQFYDYHEDVLNQSLGVIEQRGYATQSELAYLDSGMQRWDEHDQNFEKQFRALVDAFTAKAKEYDQQAEYSKQYYDRLHQLQNKKPYPSGEIDALNSRHYRDVKAFEDRMKQIGSGQRAEDNIQGTASKHVFAVLKKVPGNRPPVTPLPDGESLPISSPKAEPPKPSTQNDRVLAPPSIPDVIRKKCEGAHPEEMKQIAAEEKEIAHLREQADYFRREAETARRHAAEYRKLFQQAIEAARRSEGRGEREEANKDRERAEKYKNDAEYKEAEAKLDMEKAEQNKRAAQFRGDRVKQLKLKVLKDCQK